MSRPASPPPPNPSSGEPTGRTTDPHDSGSDGDTGTTSAATPESPACATVLGWTRGDRRFVLIAGGLILALMLVHWARLSWRGAPAVEIERLEPAANRFQFDVNQATWVEWMQLEGIGEALSRRIVNDREQNGPFRSVDDLQRVRGIGPKTLEDLRPWLRCADCPPASDGEGP
jgi:competence protein ComEA